MDPVIQYLDSASSGPDTIRITINPSIWLINYLIADELKKGNVRVFYKRRSSFVDTILHRLEVYGERGDRFFYLPDGRPFFFVREISGIYDCQIHPQKNHQEYLREGEKLASLGKE